MYYIFYTLKTGLKSWRKIAMVRKSKISLVNTYTIYTLYYIGGMRMRFKRVKARTFKHSNVFCA